MVQSPESRADSAHDIEGTDAFSELYAELRALARRSHGRHPHHTLNTTVMVHEAWLKLRTRRESWNDREHFLGTAAMAMRQVLVDYARYRTAEKRDCRLNEPMAEIGTGDNQSAEELLALNQALEQLEAVDPSLVHVVVLRFFAGLSLPEIASYMQVSPRTASRLWNKARAYLQTVLAASHD